MYKHLTVNNVVVKYKDHDGAIRCGDKEDVHINGDTITIDQKVFNGRYDHFMSYQEILTVRGPCNNGYISVIYEGEEASVIRDIADWNHEEGEKGSYECMNALLQAHSAVHAGSLVKVNHMMKLLIDHLVIEDIIKHKWWVKRTFD